MMMPTRSFNVNDKILDMDKLLSSPLLKSHMILTKDKLVLSMTQISLDLTINISDINDMKIAENGKKLSLSLSAGPFMVQDSVSSDSIICKQLKECIMGSTWPGTFELTFHDNQLKKLLQDLRGVPKLASMLIFRAGLGSPACTDSDTDNCTVLLIIIITMPLLLLSLLI